MPESVSVLGGFLTPHAARAFTSAIFPQCQCANGWFATLWLNGSFRAVAAPLEFYVLNHVAAVTEPFAVLLCRGLLHTDFALHDELFKPIFAADKFRRSRLTERDAESAEHETHQVELVAVGYVGVSFHYSFTSSAIYTTLPFFQ